MMMIPNQISKSLYEKAAAVAIKVEQLSRLTPFGEVRLRPDDILAKATAVEIDRYYEGMCKQ
jgi:hypothetical protein